MPFKDPEDFKRYQATFRKRPEEKVKRAARSRAERLKDPTRIKRNIQNYRKRLKAEVHAAYGNRCSCSGCDVTDSRFLTLDHPNNDGAEHRKTVKSNDQLYLRLKKAGFPPIVRLLCWNCNCGRHWNGGVCPHLSIKP